MSVHDYDLILAPSYAVATAFNARQAACADGGLFGVCAQPFDAWLEKLWEQNGDGRVLASSLHAQIAADKVLHAREMAHLAVTPGLAQSLCECARYGFGIPAFDECLKALPHVDGLAPAEIEFLGCLRAYRDELGSHGSIERGDAWAALAHAEAAVLRSLLRICVLGDAPLTGAQQAFFDAHPHWHVECAQPIGNAPIGMPEGRQARFAFSAGAYARPAVVLQVLDDMLAAHPGARIAVTAKDALGMYERLEPALSRRGIACSVRSVIRPFARTSFGRAFTAAIRATGEGMPWDKDSLATVLHAALAHVRKSSAWKFDKQIRSDRLITHGEALEMLRTGGDIPGQRIWTRAASLLAAAEGARRFERTALFDAALDQALAGFAADGLSLAFIREQQGALDALRGVFEGLELFGHTDPDALMRLMGCVRVPASKANYAQDAAHPATVAFMPLNRAAACAPESFDALVVCDLSSESYPLRESRSAAFLLLKRLGMLEEEPPLVRARRQFQALLRVARTSIVLERSLNDENGNPLYPAAMWEELVDAYREGVDLYDRSDLDDTYALPANLMATRYDAGEDDVWADMRPGVDSDELAFVQAQPVGEALSGCTSFAERIGFPYASQDPRDPDACVRLSPSAAEVYLDCPRKWFATRRLKTDGLDEGIGGREQGTFLHGVFQTFYSRFGTKVTEENRAQAEELMFGSDGESGVFDEVLRAQYGELPGNRYAPIEDTSEMYDALYMRQRVRAWLDFETGFLPGFAPVAFECQVPDQPYAGGMMRGKIDRIDVDSQGRAVIVDYKGSLDRSYSPLAANRETNDLEIQGKVQALVYAALAQGKVLAIVPSDSENGLRREKSMLADAGDPVLDSLPDGARTYPIREVAGALYMSYKKGNVVEGAINSLVISKKDVPTLGSAKASMLPADGESPLGGLTFEELLERTEERVAAAVRGIASGQVDANPSSKDACLFCPLSGCEGRLA